MPLSSKLTIILCVVLFGGFGTLATIIGLSVGHIPIILIGLLSASIGLTPAYIYFKKKIIKNKVLKNGVMIETDFLDVIRAQYQINSFTPLILRSQWFDEKNNLIYQFNSSPLSFDPSQYLETDQKIPVFINPDNPKEYYMNLEMIPRIQMMLNQRG